MNPVDQTHVVLLGVVGSVCLFLAGCGSPAQPEPNPPAEPPEVRPPKELEYTAVLETPDGQTGGAAARDVPADQSDSPESALRAEPVNGLVPPSERTSPLLTARDFVTRWNLLGPVDADALKDVELSGADGTGELAGLVRDWQPVRAADRPAGWVDLGGTLGRGDGQAGLASAWLVSPAEMAGCELRVGTTGPAEVYLNGRRVLEIPADARAARWDQDTAKNLTLKKGRNVLLVRVLDGKADDWGFFCRVTDAAGRPIETRAD